MELEDESEQATTPGRWMGCPVVLSCDNCHWVQDGFQDGAIPLFHHAQHERYPSVMVPHHLSTTQHEYDMSGPDDRDTRSVPWERAKKRHAQETAPPCNPSILSRERLIWPRIV